MPKIKFLNAKFSPVVLPKVYAPRQALLSSFHQAMADGFIYVSAQAGSGKTVSTLLWLQACKRKTIWIGLDEYDNTLSVFYKQLATGIFSVQPKNQGMKAILTDPAFSASPVAYTIKILSEMLPDQKEYALVLDDMHLINNGEILKSLPAVLRRLSNNFVTVILSRHALPEEFKSLVKNEKTGLITAEQLRFTKKEIRDYFIRLKWIITPAESQAAFMATEGWAICVNALSKSKVIDKGYAYAFSKYFEEHIWNKWEQPLRDFCLSTAAVDEFDPILAQTLSGRKDAQQVLNQLSSTNSFISLQDSSYRYHHLFQNFLQEKIVTSGVNTDKLYKKVAYYYKERGDYSRALHFWIRSGDFKKIDNFLFLFLFQNDRGVVADYADFLSTFFIKDFPPNIYKDAPVLHVLSAWYYYLTSRHEEFSHHMDAIIHNLPRIAKAGGKFVEFSILAFSVDHRITFRKKVKHYDLFFQLLEKYTPEGLATNIASFTHSLPYLHRSNLDYSEITMDPGILEEIDKTFALLLGAEWVYMRVNVLGCFSYEKNRLSEALLYNEDASSHLTEESRIEGRVCVIILQHNILWQMGKQEEARQTMAELSALTESQAQFFTPNLKAYQTKLQLFDGNVSAAKQWLDEYFVVKTNHIEVFRAFQHFTTARAYLALHKIEEAQHYLQMLKEYAQNFNRPLDQSEAGVLLCVLYWGTDQKKAAVNEMETVLELTQSYGYIRIIADEGQAVLPVLKRILNKIRQKEYTGSLNQIYVNEVILATHSFSKKHKGSYKVIASRPPKPVKLSRQQKLMLTLLGQGYRNIEICKITGLKLSTIKTHTALAYKKLEVTTSLDAVLKARELGLL